jgi:hypothetical protein
MAAPMISRKLSGMNYCGGLLSYQHAGGVADTAFIDNKEGIMGKYFIAWLLGVPAIVLVLFYLFFR